MLDQTPAETTARPEVVVLCGSTTYMSDFAEAIRQETVAGRIVLSVGCNLKEPHELWDSPDKAEALKARLDALHRAKIRMADRVLIVGRHIGASTAGEIAYARQLGKLVEFLHPEAEHNTRPPFSATLASTKPAGPCYAAVCTVPDCGYVLDEDLDGECHYPTPELALAGAIGFGWSADAQGRLVCMADDDDHTAARRIHAHDALQPDPGQTPITGQ